MEKLVDDIWKTTWSSLIMLIVILGVMRYFEEDHWWQVEKNFQPEEYKNNSFVYYSVKNQNKNELVSAELFVKNVLQKKSFGEYGVFEGILPGQTISVRIRSGEQSILTPVLRIREGEIRNLIFEKQDGKLIYLGNRFRTIKVIPSKIALLQQNGKENLVQLDIRKEIENYKLVEEVMANEDPKEKESVKQVVAKENNGNIFLTKNKFFTNLLLYSQFSSVRKPIYE